MVCSIFLLVAFCFFGISALECNNSGLADFSDQEANQEVLEFFETLAEEYEEKQPTFGELAERFEKAQLNSKKANDLLCGFAKNTG